MNKKDLPRLFQSTRLLYFTEFFVPLFIKIPRLFGTLEYIFRKSTFSWLHLI